MRRNIADTLINNVINKIYEEIDAGNTVRDGRIEKAISTLFHMRESPLKALRDTTEGMRYNKVRKRFIHFRRLAGALDGFKIEIVYNVDDLKEFWIYAS